MAESTADLGRFNVVVVGRPGCGGSTLVNAVFGAPTLARGAGEVVAHGVEHYRHEEGILGVYRLVDCEVPADSPDDHATLAALARIVEEARSRPLPEQVHAAWFLVRWGDPEPTPGQVRIVRRLSELLPVLFVVTAVPANLAGHPEQQAVQFARYIQAQLLPLAPTNTVYLTNARIDPDHPSPLHGLAELAEATFATAPEAARRAQAAAQHAQRRQRGRAIPLTSLRLRAQNWQQESLPLRTAARSYWARFRQR